jgi:hypothetical protein
MPLGMSFVGKTASAKIIKSYFDNGHLVFLNVNNGEHWVFLTGFENPNTYEVNDPGHDRLTYSLNEVVNSVVYTRPKNCYKYIIDKHPTSGTELLPLDMTSDA